MTEQEWLTCIDLRPLWDELDGETTSHRKLRLFACACCRTVWHLLEDPLYHKALCVEEEWASSTIPTPELMKAVLAARVAIDANTVGRRSIRYVTQAAQDAVRLTGDENSWAAFFEAPERVAEAVAYEMTGGNTNGAAIMAAHNSLVPLFRHIFGNPFHPYPAPASWPPLIVDLAQQLYDGADVRLVLHDALLDAGHAELAEHFRNEEWHPKGCWATDAILDRN